MAKSRAQKTAERAAAMEAANKAKTRAGVDSGPAKTEATTEATTGEKAKKKGSGTTKKKTGTVIVPESEIVEALDKDGLPKVTSTYYNTPPITPADLALQQAAKGQQAAAAARQAAEQARVDRTLRRLFGQPSDRDFMPAEVGGMPSVVDGSPFGYELGSQGGESLLDFENPRPTLPTATPFDASGFPTVRMADEPQMTLGLPAPSPSITRGLAANDFDYIPQPEPRRRRGQPPVEGMPDKPFAPAKPFGNYGATTGIVGQLVGAARKNAGPYVVPAIQAVTGGVVDLAAIGGAGLGAAYLVPPLVRGAYNSMFPPAAAPAQSPAPGLPQQQAPMNGDEPDYSRQLRESTIGTRNSSDIIRNLSRNRGMA